MEITADLYLENHRRQLMSLGAGVLLLLLLGLLPSTERALFFDNGRGVPKVFAVIPSTADEVPAYFDFAHPRRSAFLARLARPARSPAGAAEAPSTAPSALIPPSPESLVPLGATPLADPTAPTNSLARNFQNTPLAGSSSPQFGPAGTPDEVVDPAVDPVGAVPEPGTWLSMIIGFFVIGSWLRSQRKHGSVELETIAR
ncbi:MAG: PEP-CTERM sorting domain-containing protein [Novosphingobium sp.]